MLHRRGSKIDISCTCLVVDLDKLVLSHFKIEIEMLNVSLTHLCLETINRHGNKIVLILNWETWISLVQFLFQKGEHVVTCSCQTGRLARKLRLRSGIGMIVIRRASPAERTINGGECGSQSSRRIQYVVKWKETEVAISNGVRIRRDTFLPPTPLLN